MARSGASNLPKDPRALGELLADPDRAAEFLNTTPDKVRAFHDAFRVEFDRQRLEEDQLQLFERARQNAWGAGRLDLRNAAPPVAGAVAGVRNPLAYDAATLTALQAAISGRRKARFTGTGGGVDEITNAALTTSEFGQPAEWGANVIGGPRLLHVAAGVPRQDIDAVLAEHPKLTLPTATGSVGEGASLVEFSSSTAGVVTLGRFGRFTDLSRESQIGTDAGSLIGMHQIGIALDLDAVLIAAVETAAGTAVAFSADVPAAIRTAMAGVIAATALDDARRLVILSHPDDVALLEDVSPIGGNTIAEPFQRFSGALVYPSNAVTTGEMTVANLAAGARFFEAQGMVTETDADVKTGVRTVATSTIAGYGIGVVGAFAIKVDVVSP